MFKFRAFIFTAALVATAACGGSGEANPTASTLLSNTPAAETEAVNETVVDTVDAPTQTVEAIRMDLGVVGAEFVYGGLDIVVEEAYLTNEFSDGTIDADSFRLEIVALLSNPFDDRVDIEGAQLRLSDSTTLAFNSVAVDPAATSRSVLTVHEWLGSSAAELGFEGDLPGAMSSFANSTIIFGPTLETLEVSLDGTVSSQAPTVTSQIGVAVVRDEGMNDPEGGDLVEFSLSQITVSPDHMPWQPYFFGGQSRAEAGRRLVAVDAVVSDFATSGGGSNVGKSDVRLVIDGATAEVLAGPNEIASDGVSFESTWLFDAPAEASSVELHIYQNRGDAKDAPAAIVVLDPAVWSEQVPAAALEVQQLSDDTRIS